MRHNTPRLLPTITTYSLPILGLLIGAWCADRPIGIVLSLGEPLLLALLLTMLVSALMANQRALAISILVSGVIGAVAMNHPTQSDPPRSDGPEWMRTLKGCAILSQPAKSTIRLIMWSIDDDQNIADAMPKILDLKPDVIVFNGSARIDVGGHLSDALNGEVKFLANEHANTGLTAVVRGSFQYCGEEKDTWKIPFSTASETSAQAFIAFPYIEDVGSFPLIISRLTPRPGIANWLDWAQTVQMNVLDIANGVSTIGTRKMVLMGDFQIPHHSSSMTNPFTHAGLRPAISDPNWPATVMGIPFLTQHALDQAWVGRGWTIQTTRTLRIGNQSRFPVLFDLAPKTKL